MTIKHKYNNQGLTSDEVKVLQERFGKNELTSKKNQNFIMKVIHIISEPMFLLLIAAAVIYFILGEPRDGLIMMIFVVGVISIDVIQEWKTDKTLNALKELSAPNITVIRDGNEIEITSTDIVPGDLMRICEGVKIPADGEIVKCNDFCVDESSLTGESERVWKTSVDNNKDEGSYWRKDYCYAGTLCTQGSATVYVNEIGDHTEYGKVGLNAAEAPNLPTPMQKQTNRLIKTCTAIAIALFMLVGFVTWLNISGHTFAERLIESILSGITLAMAMIPEEFPVILVVFLSMGAWRLAKKKSLVRKLSSVETLGEVSVLCVDKTGTITLNEMTVQKILLINGDQQQLCETMGLACESNAFDPMEKAMLKHCESVGICNKNLHGGELISEYAFTNELKIMGHVWKRNNEIVITAKGSPEMMVTISNMSNSEKKDFEEKAAKLSSDGLRVIAVGVMKVTEDSVIPKQILDCCLTILGLIGLADPPRESVKHDMDICKRAGIRVVMITGDNGITASCIAKKIGMSHNDNIITGDMINEMTDEQLQDKVRTVSIFSRVIPEHKMRIVKAFKDIGEIVAMTGDGVNDAPALKYADIGIAMGKRGSEVSREAADLILLDDNFSTIVDSVKNGRRIYDNIRKAVGYVFIIHIPIALSSLIAPMLGISPTNLMLLPLHVVLLELIIDPTCSIILERQPAERNIMDRKPRDPLEKLLTSRLLFKSIIQGIIIFCTSFGTYFTILILNGEVGIARSMGLAIIIISNLFLVQVNSSNSDLAIHSFKRLVKDKVMWIADIATLVLLIIVIYSPLNNILKLSPLSIFYILISVGLATAAVFWFEIVKILRRYIDV